MEEKLLYHYTAPLRWKQIKKSGYLKLTPSNLKKLKNPKMVTMPDGTKSLVDETDDYKPVVWLTDSESPSDMGLNAMGVQNEKEKIQIAIKFDKEKHHWWVNWKDRNRMDKKMFQLMTSHGEKYASWYVCEEEIPLEDILYVKEVETGKIIYGDTEKKGLFSIFKR